MSILITIFSIVALLVLHEFGHFIVAKKCGVKVEEFGIGYPPKLFGKKFGETLYSVNLIPFGAFVKIYGEEGGIENARSFSKKPAWQRALILLGGVVSFWIVAAVLLTIIFGMGVTQAISDEEAGAFSNPKVRIFAVASGSPAETAGIQAGDAINQLSINNQQFITSKVKEVQEFTEQHKGEEILVTIERGNKIFDMSLTPRVSPPEGEGAMGISLVRTAEKSYPWWQCPLRGLQATVNLTGAIIIGWTQIIGNLVQGQGLPAGVQLMGPVGIGSLMNQAAQVGINYFLQFIATISIYLAIFNILPIPALDGGRLLFLGIEKIKGVPVNQKIEHNITAAFFALLILLMIWVTVKDVVRLF